VHDRVDNLDLIRAAAIIAVVFYHTIQMIVGVQGLLWKVALAGQYGVDLFFVLSGYLIGGLYWAEVRKFGRVEALRFIARRALRTVPPYIVALALSYAAVRLARHELFEWRYLWFGQNYDAQMPFFDVSWSLCIEEHFYLVLPFVLAIALSEGSFTAPALLLSAPLISLCSRAILLPQASQHPFGYVLSATHLRLDGLALGVLLSYVKAFYSGSLASVTRYKGLIFAAALLVPLLLPWLPVQVSYVGGYAALAVVFTCATGLAVRDCAWTIARLKLTKVIAATSYSVYLTHALMIHVVLRVVHGPKVVVWCVAVLGSFAVGYVFHKLVERPAIRTRDRLVPRRAEVLPVSPPVGAQPELA
jgi:peptidoglycan/LPS O-acetylase OafA/YrhL